MSNRNVPDDWNSYYRYCSYCNTKWHASEGGCNCVACDKCGQAHHEDTMNDFRLCEECQKCTNCSEIKNDNIEYYIIWTDNEEVFDPNNPPKDTYMYCQDCKIKFENENKGYLFIKTPRNKD